MTTSGIKNREKVCLNDDLENSSFEPSVSSYNPTSSANSPSSSKYTPSSPTFSECSPISKYYLTSSPSYDPASPRYNAYRGGPPAPAYEPPTPEYILPSPSILEHNLISSNYYPSGPRVKPIRIAPSPQSGTFRVVLPGIQHEADESLVGEQCGICLKGIKEGMRMIRLSCNCNYIICHRCVVNCLALKNKCPFCRHSFE